MAHVVKENARRTVVVPVADIELGPDHRKPSPDAVARLGESIDEIGLQAPIMLKKRASAEGTLKPYLLVFGGHRLEVYRARGWEEIEAFVIGDDVSDLDAELCTIDENLCRVPLSTAELTHAVARRKEIYEAKHPETKHGGVGNGRGKKSRKVCDSTSQVDRFTVDTAKKTGKSERTIQLYAHRGEELGYECLAKIRGTSLDKGKEIDALTKMSKRERDALTDRAAAGEDVTAQSAEGKCEETIAAIGHGHGLEVPASTSGTPIETIVVDPGSRCPICHAPKNWKELVERAALDSVPTVGEAA
jgi:hypothetical protein